MLENAFYCMYRKYRTSSTCFCYIFSKFSCLSAAICHTLLVHVLSLNDDFVFQRMSRGKVNKSHWNLVSLECGFSRMDRNQTKWHDPIINVIVIMFLLKRRCFFFDFSRADSVNHMLQIQCFKIPYQFFCLCNYVKCGANTRKSRVWK